MAKTNSGLVEYVNAQVGKPYWFGTFGQIGSASLYEQKKDQYPKYYTAKDFASQYGQRVHDCVGLIKGYIWSETPTSRPKYDAKQDVGADSLYKMCPEKGEISSFQKIAGQCVFKGTNAKKSHIGVYVGDNKVVEAKGHKYGVIVSDLSDDWSYWGQCCWIEKDNVAQEPVATPEPVVTPEPTQLTDDEVTKLAKDVMAGKYGDNPKRKKKLVAEYGEEGYSRIQKRVNELIASEKTAQAPAPSGDKYKVRTNGSSLALRKRPDNDAIRICWMPNGSEVTVDDKRGNWSHTTFNGQTGWAFTKWLEKI